MNTNCPICGTPEAKLDPDPNGRDAALLTCTFCGSGALSESLVASLEHYRSSSPDASTKLAHALRQMARGPNPSLLTSAVAEAILKRPLPRPREQADLLIRWLAENVRAPGEKIWIQHATHGAIIGSRSRQGFELVVDHLFSQGLITGNQSKTIGGGDAAHATLSFGGWDRYENLRLGGAIYRKAFMAMKFGDPILEHVLESAFKPSVKAAGFDLLKLSDVPRAGLIDNRLRAEIQAADFVVADLSHDNLGAYWEAGYAEGLGKPVIYTCELAKFEATRTHFDTNHHLTILWDRTDLEKAGIELKATIRATLPHLAILRDDV
jgi:hypothetical protein